MEKLTEIIKSFVLFINSTLVPLIFAIAFIVFLYGVFNYFIAGGASPEKRQSGVQFITYSIIGFFVMISVWGLVNILIGTFQLDSSGRPCLPTFGKDADCTGNSSTGTSATTQLSPNFIGPRE